MTQGIFNEIIALLNEHYYRYVIMVGICIFAIVAAMTADLVLGVKKARENGEATTSTGLKKTCDKARKYFSPFVAAMCVDLVICAVSPIPIVCMAWTIYCVICEFVSIREKAWQKAEIRRQERTMEVVLNNKDDLAKAIAEALKIMTEQSVEVTETSNKEN